jgi:cyclopropane fatty-acyl-phospholipid synthase-like methyltransferase
VSTPPASQAFSAHAAEYTSLRRRLVPDFDAIVSALAIHHLEDAEKRSLFARIHERLRPGGVFVNAEQVVG